MKEKMYSKQSNTQLHYHILDGFAATHDGIKTLKKTGYIKDGEYTELLEKNIERLIARVREFRIAEKIVAVGFACLFTWLQISNDDIEMRRARRVRLRRRNEKELPMNI